MSFPVPANEPDRLESLRSYGILDTAPELDFDEISDLAAEICQCPAAYISLIDDTRQWIKSLCNLPMTMCESPRDAAICSTTICFGDVLVVPDLQKDERFWQFPLVTQPPHLRFYCGAPLLNSKGHALGSLCVVDFEPRDLDFAKRDALRRLAHQAVTQLELRRSMALLQAAQAELTAEKAMAERLLLNVLPAAVARELRENNAVEPRFYQSASILFTDFHGFTRLVEGMMPRQLIDIPDQFFSAFDEIAQRHRLEKLKTVGDAYMCAGGLPDPNKTHAADCCLAALEMQAYVARLNRERQKLRMPLWEMRIGINTGFVTAGVVGKRRFTYDVWGNTVNEAARMESSGEPGRINISDNTWGRVKHLFEGEPRGLVDAKNKGPLLMHFLNRIKPEYSADRDGLRPNEQFRAATVG